MNKFSKLYEGKAKILYKTDDPAIYIQYFKDDMTAFNAQKKAVVGNKGILNNQFSGFIFEMLGGSGIKTHYIKKLNDREMAVRALEIIPLEVVMRNRIAGSLAKRLGMEEGKMLATPMLEFFYKNDALGDPMVSESGAISLGWLTEAELAEIQRNAFKICKLLTDFFSERGIDLVDFKLEFGKDREGNMYLADEISPDSCRLWEKGTQRKLDKDVFRRDLGNVTEAYEKVSQMIGIEI